MTGYGAAHPYQMRWRAEARARAVEAVIAQEGGRHAIMCVAAEVGVTEETLRRWLRADHRTVFVRPPQGRTSPDHRSGEWRWDEGVTPP